MLTPAQLATLKADILANPAFTGWNLGNTAQEVASWYNVEAEPAFVVWCSSVSSEEWDDAILGTTGAATQLDALTASKRDSLFWALGKTLNPSIAATRAALDDFCGSQNTLKAAIAAAQKRNATRAEKLFATGTGSTASPATMGFENDLSYPDVEDALRS